jgi:hypothetical protein
MPSLFCMVRAEIESASVWRFLDSKVETLKEPEQHWGYNEPQTIIPIRLPSYSLCTVTTVQ